MCWPLTFKSWAAARKEVRSSWAILTSPWYMKLSKETRSEYLTFFRYSRGWLCLWRWKRVLKFYQNVSFKCHVSLDQRTKSDNFSDNDTHLKKGEHAARISLWAWISSSSTAIVTSNKSLSSLSSLKASLMFLSKSFHCKQKLSPGPISFSVWNR